MTILNVRTQAPNLAVENNPILKLEQYLSEQQTENKYLFEQIAKALTDLENSITAINESITAQEEGEGDGEVT